MKTISSVAKRAGVSPSTVSRVLNHRECVDPVTAKKVLEVIEETGYQPNLIAKSLKVKKTNNILIIIPSLKSTYWVKVIEGIQDEAMKQGYSVFIGDANENSQTEQALLNSLKHGNFDGAILTNTFTPIETLVEQYGRCNLVLCTHYFKQSDIATVSIDNMGIVKQATQYLVDRNHKKILLINGPEAYAICQDRVFGFMSALNENRIIPTENMVFHVNESKPFSYENGYKIANELFSKDKNIATALLVYSDEMAIGVMQALADLGLRVPDDVSVIGLDGTKLAHFSTPMLTTVQQPMYQIGKNAMKKLVDILNGIQNHPDAPQLFDANIKERGSVKILD